MAPIDDAESNPGKRGITTAKASEWPDTKPGGGFRRTWQRTLLARMTSAVAVLLIFALPASLAFSSKNYIYARIPFLKQLGLRFPSNKSAVLAVDVDGLMIQSQSVLPNTTEQFEKAAMAQLANLHRTYSAWAENHEDLSGSLLVRLRVDRSGTVVHVDPLAERLSNAIFTRVVLSEIRRWSFPAGAAESAEITMPLLFVPKGIDPSTVVHWERKTRFAEQDGTTARRAGGAASTTIAPAPRAIPALDPSSNDTRDGGIKQVRSINANKSAPAKQVLPTFKTLRAVGLRNQPRYSAMRVHEIDADTELSVLERQGDWLKVQAVDTASVGFVRKEFLTPIH